MGDLLDAYMVCTRAGCREPARLRAAHHVALGASPDSTLAAAVPLLEDDAALDPKRIS